MLHQNSRMRRVRAFLSPANGLANLPAKRRIRRGIEAATASRRQRHIVLTLPLRIAVKRPWTASSLVGHR
ncbi:MAG: hypothetical protein H0Z34_08455 [Brevibacillus sp.]|nr:hypothetical protein [Brevibacillus sp.]